MSRINRKKQIELLTSHADRLSRKMEYFQQISSRFSRYRLVYFITAVIGLYLLKDMMSDGWYALLMMAALIGFIVLAVTHRKTDRESERMSILLDIKKEHIARMNLDWDGIREYEFSRSLKDHPFGADLDIIGQKSLHHLLDTTIYPGSHDLLADWLLNSEPDPESVKRRVQVVKELSPLMLFRDRLRVVAEWTRTKSSEKDWTMEQLLKWLGKRKETGFRIPLIVLGSLSVINIGMALAALAGIIPAYVIIPFVVYLAYYNFHSGKIKGLYDSAFQMEKLLSRFGAILLEVENFKFNKHSSINQVCGEFKKEGNRPSEYLKKISRLAGAASLQKNQVLWPLVNMVIPWDMFFSKRMEELKDELEPHLKAWLYSFYELEALNALATFTDLHPEYTFPEFKQGQEKELSLKAIDLGHPLIHPSQKVTNDFTVNKNKSLFLITGSNMAGKSTFLRTVGVNLCLAFAGAPVNAKSLTTGPFRLFTSINVTDSLEEGFSHFYTEVRRLRMLLEELNKDHPIPLFYFVDEIFRGTNNRERLLGSTAFLKEVAGKPGVGMVSTHDLELATLEPEIPELINYHFEETIEEGKMSFEYKLKNGPSQSTNALRIMEMEGLPV